MKKFFNLFITALVMCAAVSMTSCSNDDNDEISTVKLKVYEAVVSRDILTYYDVKLVLSNDQKTKEVTLTRGDGELVDTGSSVDPSALKYKYMDIDGTHGIKTVKATVTPKANIEEILADTKSFISLMSQAWLLDATYYTSAQEWYGPDDFNLKFPEPKILEAADMLKEVNGKKQYAILAEGYAESLSSK